SLPAPLPLYLPLGRRADAAVHRQRDGAVGADRQLRHRRPGSGRARGRPGGPMTGAAAWRTGGLIAALAWLWLAAAALAQPSFPALTGRVVDEAGLLTPAQERELEGRLAALESRTTDQLVVVTVRSLQGYEIEEYGYQLGRAWGIGQSAVDNGVLLIVAPNERQV